MLSAHHYQPTDAYATDTASGKQGTYHDGGSGEDAAKNAAAGAMVDLFNNKLSALSMLPLGRKWLRTPTPDAARKKLRMHRYAMRCRL